jgi:hypothetical protein
VLTNVTSPLYQNFAQSVVPEKLKDAPLFFLNNPIALQKRYIKLKDAPNMKRRRANWRNMVTAAEQDALEMLAGFFDWLDGLERPLTTGVVSPHKKSQNIKAGVTDLLTPKGQAVAKEARNSEAFTSLASSVRTLSALQQNVARYPRKGTTRISGRNSYSDAR